MKIVLAWIVLAVFVLLLLKLTVCVFGLHMVATFFIIAAVAVVVVWAAITVLG